MNDRPQRLNEAPGVHDGSRDRFCMHIQTDESDILLHDRLLSYVALRYEFSDSQA